MALSIDIRRRVISCHSNGEGSYATLAKRFKLALNTVRRWVELWKETGDVRKRDRGGGRNHIIPSENLAILCKLVEDKPDQTLQGLCVQYKVLTQVEVKVPTMFNSLERAGLSLKKSRSGLLSKSTYA